MDALNAIMQDTARDAVSHAVTGASYQLRSLKGGALSFYPVVDYDERIIGVGVNPEYHYLIYQERGFASFPMKELYGKVVPMNINGRIIFRKVTHLNRFQSGYKDYWVRNSDGELIAENKQSRSWVHPGLPPKNFMQDAVFYAIEDNQDEIDQAFLENALKG